jgi:hypothetical protein
MLLPHRLKSPDDLLQADGRPDPVVSRPKDKIAEPRARILEVRAPLYPLPELGKHLPTISAWKASVGERLSIN